MYNCAAKEDQCRCKEMYVCLCMFNTKCSVFTLDPTCHVYSITIISYIHTIEFAYMYN